MRFVCDSCRAQYMISDEKVGAKGVKVRCKKCGYVILVRRQDTGGGVAAAAERRPQAPAEGNGHDSLLKGVEDDEIGAVFDQVLSAGSSGPKPRPQIDAAAANASFDDDEGADTTRVMDLATMKKLAEQTGDGPASNGEGQSEKTEISAPINGAASHEWFVAIDEKQVGPLTLEKVKSHWDRGELAADSLCWRAGFSDWMPVSDAEELASVLAPKPPKPVISAPMVTGAAASAPVESAFAAGSSAHTTGKPTRADIPVLAPEPATEADVSWKPSAATALASLVQDEMKALNKPAPKTNGTVSAEVPVAVVSGLLDVPAPAPNMPAASERSGPVHAPVANGTSNYSAPPYVPTYAVPSAPRSRGALIAIVSGVGFVVVVLLGAVVFLLYQSNMRPPPQPVQVTAAPVTAAPVAPTAPTPPVAAPAAPAGTAAAPGTTAAPATSGPPAVAAATPREPEPRGPAVVTVPPRERTPRVRRGRPDEGGPAARSETPAPPPVDNATDGDFEDVFGVTKGGPKPSAPKPKPTVYIPPAPGEGAILDRLGQSDIMQVVVSHKSAIVKCVEQQKKADPGASGKLVVRWTVQTSGKTSGIAVQTDDMKGSVLANCITGLVRSWTFPKSKVQGDPIDFPFTF